MIMLLVFALQFALPLLLIGWTGFAPARSALGFCIQAIAVAAALFAAGLTGLWLFPPWWAAWVFGAMLLAAVVMGWRRRSPFASQLPSGTVAWLSTAAFAAIGGWGAVQSASALAGRALQPGMVVDLAFPLEGGEYLVVNGGSTISINAHLMTLDAGVARFHAYRGQSYGVDIVKLGRWGLRADGVLPPQPGAYEIYGVPVYAPCAGDVIAARDGLPDMQVPQMDRDHMAGNHLLLRCKQADVLLGHLKPGSLNVAVGQRVSTGQAVANVGNSGNTGEPHLHIHAQMPGTATEPFSGNPLAVRFDGRFRVRNDRFAIP
jgi:hypothetical protein